MDTEQTKKFKKGVEELINGFSLENYSDTPDFIIAEYLTVCLLCFNKNKWTSLKDELPTEEGVYLAKTKDGKVRICEYFKRMFFENDVSVFPNVTHWKQVEYINT